MACGVLNADGMRTLCRLSLVVVWTLSSTACVASGSSVDAGGAGGAWSTETGVSSSSKSGANATSVGSTTEVASTSSGSTSYPSSSAVSSTSTSSSTSAVTSTSAMSSSASGMPCQQGTHIAYGSLWKAPLNHPEHHDDVLGMTVTWDGVCAPQAPSSSATLSNGWGPYFDTTDGCVIALDPECPTTPPAPCVTRITYGASWLAAANHPDNFDDIPGKITWSNNRLCVNSGNESYADLSNGWRPYFQGTNGCEMSFRYENCLGV